MFRKTTADVVMSGYQVPKNTFVFRLGALASLDEQNFKQANTFLPERWIRGIFSSFKDTIKSFEMEMEAMTYFQLLVSKII